MAVKLHYGKQSEERSGFRTEGYVEWGKKEIPVTLLSNRGTTGGDVDIFAHGWTESPRSMELMARTSRRLGVDAIMLEYSNAGFANPLGSNADDIAAVIAAMPRAATRRVIGHSMGGALTPQAIMKSNTPVEAAALVAPAFTTSAEAPTKLLQRLTTQTWEETLHMWTDINYACVALDGIMASARRTPAVASEFFHLIAPHNFTPDVAALPATTKTLLAKFERDNIVPLSLLDRASKDMCFTRTELFPGGHTDAVNNHVVADEIITITHDLSHQLDEAA